MATVDQSGIRGKIRDKPITRELESLLQRAADAAGIDVVLVTSGGQPGTHGRRTGSTRHDGGRAADLKLEKDGRILKFTDQDGGVVEAFVTAAAARGAIGIGAGVNYMGNEAIHVGFGTSLSDRTKLVWGAQGRSANAPAWLREAAQEGWDHPVTDGVVGPSNEGSGRFVVIARGGLRLRSGPGTGFGIITTIEAGTEVTVVGFDGGGEWARVDLQGDGLVDGHLFAAFLRPAGSDDNEDVAEPGEGED